MHESSIPLPQTPGQTGVRGVRNVNLRAAPPSLAGPPPRARPASASTEPGGAAPAAPDGAPPDDTPGGGEPALDGPPPNAPPELRSVPAASTRSPGCAGPARKLPGFECSSSQACTSITAPANGRTTDARI